MENDFFFLLLRNWLPSVRRDSSDGDWGERKEIKRKIFLFFSATKLWTGAFQGQQQFIFLEKIIFLQQGWNESLRKHFCLFIIWKRLERAAFALRDIVECARSFSWQQLDNEMMANWFDCSLTSNNTLKRANVVVLKLTSAERSENVVNKTVNWGPTQKDV